MYYSNCSHSIPITVGISSHLEMTRLNVNTMLFYIKTWAFIHFGICGVLEQIPHEGRGTSVCISCSILQYSHSSLK
jgi:hypothetical protein